MNRENSARLRRSVHLQECACKSWCVRVCVCVCDTAAACVYTGGQPAPGLTGGLWETDDLRF